MADPVFLMRVLAASLVAVVLLLGAGNGMGGTTGPLVHSTGHMPAGK